MPPDVKTLPLSEASRLKTIQRGYFSSVRSQATSLQRRHSNFCSGQLGWVKYRAQIPSMGRHTSLHFHFSFTIFQPLLPRSKERWRAQTHSGSQASKPLAYAVVQDVNYQTDPCAHLPRGLVFDCGSKRCIHSHPHSPPSQPVLEICV